MDRIYYTKLIVSTTNLSFTVPVNLVRSTKTPHRAAYEWTEAKKGNLILIPFEGTEEEAEGQALVMGNVVFLQRMVRKGGKPQYKFNLPKWIYEQKHLDQADIVKMEWVKDKRNKITGKVLIFKED